MLQRAVCRTLRPTFAIAMVALLLSLCPAPATQLMPPGQQQFLSANGVPLAGGFVYMYQPNTTICKTTWQDSSQTNPNTCPIVLDASGSAVIYGSGCYTQEVRDSTNVALYSKTTCEPGSAGAGSAGPVVWGGTASALGTPNAIQLPTATSFSASDGQVVAFIPIATNTGATTVAAGTQGPVPVVKDTTGGPVALAGGEIIFSGSGNIIYMEYSATQNQFHLLNTAIASTSGANTSLCSMTGLQVTNNAGTPNTIASITAFGATLRTNTGLLITRSTVSVTVNTTLGNVTSAAGGMDGEAPGVSAWLFLFIIDNGSAPQGLASLAAGNGGAPTLPSGYNYYCYVGAMRVDGSGNFLRTLQRGNRAQYVLTPAGALPVMNTATQAYWTAIATGTFVPPLATRIQMLLNASVTGATQSAAIAPNANYSTNPNVSVYPPCAAVTNNANTTVVNMVCDLLLESTNVYIGSSGAAPKLNAFGWTDVVSAN